jgi:hypothetical protein
MDYTLHFCPPGVGSTRTSAAKQHSLGASHRRTFSLAMITCSLSLLVSTPQPMLRMLQQFRMRRGRLHLSEITQHWRATQWKQSDC